MACTYRYAKYQHVHGNTVTYTLTGTGGYNYLYYAAVGLDVQNNDINNCRYGFYCYAAPPSGSTPANYLFENNDLEATYYGIYVSGSGIKPYTQPGHVLIQEQQHSLWRYVNKLWYSTTICEGLYKQQSLMWLRTI